MPGRVLPTLLASEIQSHNTEKSCYVTIGSRVYDITTFLDDHPGGSDLILDHGGQEVGEIMKNEASHYHSDAAYEILEDNLIGFVATEKIVDAATDSNKPDNIVPLPPNEAGMNELRKRNASKDVAPTKVYAATGMSSAADLSVETDAASDFQKHNFIDLNRPMFLQLWNGGFSKAFYLEQVHRPRHYKGGQSAPLFGNFLEPLSKTPWWVVPMVWLPWVGYGTALAFQNLSNPLHAIAYFLGGLGIWTLVEYTLHRGLFHVDQ
jgi:4-hydroxysphinganine ceramide fatty acyl 2-hydroxylase